MPPTCPHCNSDMQPVESWRCPNAISTGTVIFSTYCTPTPYPYVTYTPTSPALASASGVVFVGHSATSGYP